MAASPRSSSQNLIAHSRLLYDYTYNMSLYLYLQVMILLRQGTVYSDYTVAAVHVISLYSRCSFLQVTGCHSCSKISKPDSSRCPTYDVIISSRTQMSIINLLAVKRACAQFFFTSHRPPWSSASVGVGVRTRRSLSFPVPRRNAI